MTEKTNPFLEPTNYFEGYQKEIDKLKNAPEALSFERLCYEIFEMTEDGKTLMDMIEERYLLPSIVQMNANYQIMCIHGEGFKDAFRLLRNCVASHKQRIKAEVNK